MSWEKYRRWIEQVEQTDAYQAAGLEIEFTEELCRVMEERGVSRAELARRAGTSPAYITKVLRGSTNFTLATMAKLARALGMEVRLHLAPRGSRTVWKDVLTPFSAWPEGGATIEFRRSSEEDGAAGVAPGRPARYQGAPMEPMATRRFSVSDWEGGPGENPTDQVA